MLKQIIKEIKKAEKIALFHHIHPDGDSISCSYGLALALKKKFPNKEIVFVADKNEIIKSFPEWELKSDFMVTKIDSSFLAIIGDAAVSKRIAYYEEFDKASKKIVFDHHKLPLTPDFKHDLYWREDNFIASAMQANILVKALKVKLNEEIAYSLMFGLVTDSGHFSYSANDSKVVEIYASLLKYISKDKMIKFFNAGKIRTKENFELLQQVLSSVKYSKHTSYVFFDKKFVEKYGRENIKEKVNSIGNIEGYPMWMMVVEREEKTEEGYAFDVSLRSNGPSILDVATKYGGGGHEKASGCKLKKKTELVAILKDLDEVMKQI